MAITGITYDNQGPTATSDAVFHENIFTDGVLRGCEISFVGAQVTIAPGYLISAGRLCAFQAAETVPVPAQLGVARVVLQTNLGEESSSGAFNQLSLVVQTASTVGGLPALIKEDINGGGVIYQQAICTLNVTSTGIQSILEGPKGARLNMKAVKIGSANFDGSDDITLGEMGAASLNSYGKVDAVQAASHMFSFTASETLNATHCGGFLSNNGAASAITLTIPNDDNSEVFPLETEIEICRYAASELTIKAGDNVYLRGSYLKNSGGIGYAAKINNRYSSVVLKKITNWTWLVTGDAS